MISAILLAAGESSRMGQPKALLPYDDLTFIDSILNKLEEINCEPIITILGSSAELICQRTHVNSFQCFRNPNPELGQLSSLKLAIEKLPPESEGFILNLVDHPLVKLETYQNIYSAAVKNPSRIIIPEFHGHHGHPVYFGRRFFQSLLDAQLEQGARSVLEIFSSQIKYLPVDDEGILRDIDTPDEYSQFVH